MRETEREREKEREREREIILKQIRESNNDRGLRICKNKIK